MKRLMSRLLALILVCVMGLIGCTNTPSGLSGNYHDDTLALVQSLRTAIELPEDSPDKMAAQAEARQRINDFAALYRRDGSVSRLSSYTTIRTALNSLASHYNAYPNRPIPDKLKQRLEQELKQAESALARGA